MAYRTVRRRRFAPRRSRRFARRRRFVGRVRRAVRNSIAEKKRVNYSLNNNEFDWDGLRVILDRIPQSTDEGGRVGRIVTPHAVAARLELINGVSSTAARSTWTVFLVQDLQQVGDTHATVAEIISDIGTDTAPMGLINVNNKGRFKIHRRWQGTLMHSSQPGSIKYLQFYHKFRKPRSIRYNGVLNTDIEANGLMLVFVSSGDPASDQCFVSGNVRLWYTDV